jgi:hypothetical protein
VLMVLNLNDGEGFTDCARDAQKEAQEWYFFAPPVHSYRWATCTKNKLVVYSTIGRVGTGREWQLWQRDCTR